MIGDPAARELAIQTGMELHDAPPAWDEVGNHLFYCTNFSNVTETIRIAACAHQSSIMKPDIPVRSAATTPFPVKMG